MSLRSWFTNLFSDDDEPPEPLVFGAELWCPYGSEHTFLSLETDDIDINDLPKACVDDCKALDNITPFGVCYGGSLCEYKMDLEEKWENPEPQSALINGKEIITTKSTLICRVWGLEIQAATSGQDGMFAKQIILYREMDEKYPGLLDILLDPNGSLYLNEGMYEKAIQFIADRIELHGGEIFIPTIYDQGNVEGEMIRAALERLLPYCDTSTFDRFINGLENAAVRNDMDRVSGWDVYNLNEKMIEMLKKDCKSTAEKIANDPIARELEKHRIFMSSFSDAIMQLANVAMLYRVMTIEPAEAKGGDHYKTSESEGSSKSKIGDFTNLEGSTVDDILDRIPDEATLRELYPVEGGATEGFEFKWAQEGQTYRVRVHNADPGAPAGSNAANGWTLRIQRGKQYYDYTINEFQPAGFTNSDGPFFDESIMNNTHIPILDPYAK